jgi:hypothetical protein
MLRPIRLIIRSDALKFFSKSSFSYSFSFSSLSLFFSLAEITSGPGGCGGKTTSCLGVGTGFLTSLIALFSSFCGVFMISSWNVLLPFLDFLPFLSFSWSPPALDWGGFLLCYVVNYSFCLCVAELKCVLTSYFYCRTPLF